MQHNSVPHPAMKVSIELRTPNAPSKGQQSRVIGRFMVQCLVVCLVSRQLDDHGGHVSRAGLPHYAVPATASVASAQWLERVKDHLGAHQTDSGSGGDTLSQLCERARRRLAAAAPAARTEHRVVELGLDADKVDIQVHHCLRSPAEQKLAHSLLNRADFGLEQRAKRKW